MGVAQQRPSRPNKLIAPVRSVTLEHLPDRRYQALSGTPSRGAFDEARVAHDDAVLDRAPHADATRRDLAKFRIAERQRDVQTQLTFVQLARAWP